MTNSIVDKKLLNDETKVNMFLVPADGTIQELLSSSLRQQSIKHHIRIGVKTNITQHWSALHSIT